MRYFESKVIANRQITEDIFVLQVERCGAEAAAGQYYMLKSWDTELTLMRPISIFKAEPDTLHFMYRTVGKGTAKMAELKPGDKLKLLGPAGNGYPCDQISGKVAVVGGGVGIPPLCETAKTLQAKGLSVDAYLGFRDVLFAVEDFEPWCSDIFVSTEKGEEGYRGFVTDLLKPENYDVVITCGPEVMMRKVASMCAETGTTCYCSLEHRMACGIGACLGCSIRTKNGMKRVCKDGPVFISTDLLW
jgi:dihydroorotate dehydrogenase electron transfer subunit